MGYDIYNLQGRNEFIGSFDSDIFNQNELNLILEKLNLEINEYGTTRIYKEQIPPLIIILGNSHPLNSLLKQASKSEHGLLLEGD